MPDDWDKYFPDGVQNQYCMSMSQDQATDWRIWNLNYFGKEQNILMKAMQTEEFNPYEF